MAQRLPSWRPGEIRDRILGFIDAVTTQDAPDFVPVAERIAVFDNDGTLWCEQPAQVQVLFCQRRLDQLADADPSLRTQAAFRAFLDRDMNAIHALGKKGVFEVAFRVHAGMSVPSFQHQAREWLATGGNPILSRRCLDLIYQPQLELMALLRENGFQNWIVSGGGADFIRAFAEEAYGVPPEQVIGSSVRMELRFDDPGGAELYKRPELQSFDDREVKVENIGLHIGRRPLLAFGNSDGDLAMMRYVMAGDGRRLALLLHHDDADREVAYDRDFRLSPLVEALDQSDAYGVTVVSMARDWDQVFP